MGRGAVRRLQPALRIGVSAPMADTPNPLATPDQCAVEERALALQDHPDVQRARQICTLLWTNATAWPSRDQADRFDPMIDEYMFHHAMRAANGDANFPLVA